MLYCFKLCLFLKLSNQLPDPWKSLISNNVANWLALVKIISPVIILLWIKAWIIQIIRASSNWENFSDLSLFLLNSELLISNYLSFCFRISHTVFSLAPPNLYPNSLYVKDGFC